VGCRVGCIGEGRRRFIVVESPVKKFPKIRQRNGHRPQKNKKKFTQTFVNRLMNEVTRKTKTSKTKHFDTQLSPTFAMQMSNSCGQNNGAQQKPRKTAVVKGFLYGYPGLWLMALLPGVFKTHKT